MSIPALNILLQNLRLPSMLSAYPHLAEKAAAEHWGYEEFLQALAEEEVETRRKRRTLRLLKQSHLPEGKNLATYKDVFACSKTTGCKSLSHYRA